MVRSNQAYIGSQHAQYLFVNGHTVSAVYKGHNNASEGKYFQLVYWQGFEEITFYPSESIQTWTVPAGVSKVQVECVGSKGCGNAGGEGGKVTCDLNVTSGQILYIMVGNIPQQRHIAWYNASDIRLNDNSYSNRILVAGGGGSDAQNPYGGLHQGGAGGGEIGGRGTSTGYQSGGLGGTQSAGGRASYRTGGEGYFYPGANGEFAIGGNSAGGNCGAGGGGYYGGGGGSAYNVHNSIASNSSGGGGSSYPAEDNALCTNVVHEQGVNDGPGYVTIRATKPPERIDA